jgi:hypothetical protein
MLTGQAMANARRATRSAPWRSLLETSNLFREHEIEHLRGTYNGEWDAGLCTVDSHMSSMTSFVGLSGVILQP